MEGTTCVHLAQIKLELVLSSASEVGDAGGKNHDDLTVATKCTLSPLEQKDGEQPIDVK